jgi:hypothetical protein
MSEVTSFSLRSLSQRSSLFTLCSVALYLITQIPRIFTTVSTGHIHLWRCQSGFAWAEYQLLEFSLSPFGLRAFGYPASNQLTSADGRFAQRLLAQECEQSQGWFAWSGFFLCLLSPVAPVT